ncbi:MAG: phytoene/squalene synthase family protein [Flavobacteriales bacterium]|nr:phytoene/squalene synthase family protein [Bacteroidota bacterium]MCB9240466.1 phytoene/squalene synthase family protein [Flavobacteriales bacterium]
MKQLYDTLSFTNSRAVTNAYSTSFSSGVSLLAPKLRNPIHGIYGFVRLADEIVDSFHEYDQEALLDDFTQQTQKAIRDRISLNPILNSFQHVVHDFGVEQAHIDAFLKSMRMDLDRIQYDRNLYETYIYGSAQVVGLMCLHVFCEGDRELYERLKGHAMSLGSAFQKVNFLRDIQADVNQLGRLYFPNISFDRFTDADKRIIEREILDEFDDALKGIKQLPRSSKLGVYTAYSYYKGLLRRIMRTPAPMLMEKRIRVPNLNKISLMLGSRTRVSLGQV